MPRRQPSQVHVRRFPQYLNVAGGNRCTRGISTLSRFSSKANTPSPIDVTPGATTVRRLGQQENAPWQSLVTGIPTQSFRIALGGNSRRESALPFRGPRKIGPGVPTLTLARRTRRNPSFRPPGPVRVASPTLLSHGEVIESVGRCQTP